MKQDFTFKMPTTAQGMMKQLTEWAKSLSKKEKAEVRKVTEPAWNEVIN